MSYRADKQVITAHTDGRTHRQTQATTIPEGQNWPRVMNKYNPTLQYTRVVTKVEQGSDYDLTKDALYLLSQLSYEM